MIPLLATEMNTSQAEILGAVSNVTDALQEQGGQAMNFSVLAQMGWGEVARWQGGDGWLWMVKVGAQNPQK